MCHSCDALPDSLTEAMDQMAIRMLGRISTAMNQLTEVMPGFSDSNESLVKMLESLKDVNTHVSLGALAEIASFTDDIEGVSAAMRPEEEHQASGTAVSELIRFTEENRDAFSTAFSEMPAAEPPGDDHDSDTVNAEQYISLN